MQDKTMKIWDSAAAAQFAAAVTVISDAATMRNFLRDVMTEKEIIEISSRLEAARLLQAGAKYSEITRKTKLSSRTVARISDWLKTGSGGYASVLTQLNQHHTHRPPARAE